MDAVGYLATGFGVALTPLNLALAFMGCVIGTAIGVLPGIGPLNAIALLLPFCFALKLEPSSALILLAAIYYGSGYGGRITAILLNMPGEPSAVITTLDGHPLAKQGRGSAALAVLPIPISPSARAVQPPSAKRSTTAAPSRRHASASARVMAGPYAQSRVPQPILAATRPGCAGSAAATPASTTTTRAPACRANRFTAARPARYVRTMEAVTAEG